MTEQILYRGSISALRTNRVDIALKDIAHLLGLEISLERETSFFREYVRFTVTGSKTKVNQFIDSLTKTINDHNSL